MSHPWPRTVTCYYCNEQGHLKRDCPKKVASGIRTGGGRASDSRASDSRASDTRSRDPLTSSCYNCNEQGHLKRDCPKKVASGIRTGGGTASDSRASDTRNRDPLTISCYNCNERGHFKRGCPHLPPRARRQHSVADTSKDAKTTSAEVLPPVSPDGGFHAKNGVGTLGRLEDVWHANVYGETGGTGVSKRTGADMDGMVMGCGTGVGGTGMGRETNDMGHGTGVDGMGRTGMGCETNGMGCGTDVDRTDIEGGTEESPGKNVNGTGMNVSGTGVTGTGVTGTGVTGTGVTGTGGSNGTGVNGTGMGRGEVVGGIDVGEKTLAWEGLDCDWVNALSRFPSSAMRIVPPCDRSTECRQPNGKSSASIYPPSFDDRSILWQSLPLVEERGAQRQPFPPSEDRSTQRHPLPLSEGRSTQGQPFAAKMQSFAPSGEKSTQMEPFLPSEDRGIQHPLPLSEGKSTQRQPFLPFEERTAQRQPLPQSEERGIPLPSFKPDSDKSSTSDHLKRQSFPPFVDTHCHLEYVFERYEHHGTFASFKKRHGYPRNFDACIASFCDPAAFSSLGIWSDLLSEADSGVWAAFGIHPHNAKYYHSQGLEEKLLKCVEHERCVAFGEIGLDYGPHSPSEPEVQKDVLARQLHLGVAMGKPLVLHCRDAEDDLERILSAHVPNGWKIHLHGYTGRLDVAFRFLNSYPNLYIGITGSVTYDQSYTVRTVAREVPIERLLVETDAPYNTPRNLPKAGRCRFSHPAHAHYVAKEIARLKQMELSDVLQQVRENTTNLYGI